MPCDRLRGVAVDEPHALEGPVFATDRVTEWHAENVLPCFLA